MEIHELPQVRKRGKDAKEEVRPSVVSARESVGPSFEVELLILLEQEQLLLQCFIRLLQLP